MQVTPEILPVVIKAVVDIIETNAEEVTALDQAIGDGDHVINLQRGLAALLEQSTELATLEWTPAIQKVGMTLLSTMGGASGSLFGTLFISMSKAIDGRDFSERGVFAGIYRQGVNAVMKRGKSDAGEKTMLDVLIPVAEVIEKEVDVSLADLLDSICKTAEQGMESTRDMIATKGRASYMGEKSKGHIDAGARTSQLMIGAIANTLR